MVFQRFNLFPHFTALQNVIEGPIHVKKVPRDVAVAEALALLDRVGLKNKADARPHQLSGGQQQRVAIARALAMKPLLLLFDEPTSALDHELIGEVLAVMRDLADENRTMIIVTHELRFARDVADRIVFMDRRLCRRRCQDGFVLRRSGAWTSASFLEPAGARLGRLSDMRGTRCVLIGSHSGTSCGLRTRSRIRSSGWA